MTHSAPTGSAPSFSVVICAYTDRRWHDLIEAVHSAQRQTRQPREVIVVIDHNPSVLERARATFPDAQVVENRFERGLSGARNSGVEQASGDIVAFLDDDAVADPDWLEQLALPFQDERVMGAVSTIELQWEGPTPRWFPAEFNWTVGGTYRGMPERLAPVRNLLGAAMAIRRDLLEHVRFRSAMGRTDAIKLPLGGEETELCIRLQQANRERHFVFQPAARVRHKVPQARARWSYFAQRCYAEGLSKAHVSQLVGRGDGLSTERNYALRVLPLGVLRGLRDTLKRDPSGAGRAGAIALGFGATAAGYLVGSLPSFRVKSSPEGSPATPT